MVHLKTLFFLKLSTRVARYFRDTEVWANSEPYLASSRFENFETYALNSGFSAEHFNVRFVPSNAAARAEPKNATWVAFCGVK